MRYINAFSFSLNGLCPRCLLSSGGSAPGGGSKGITTGGASTFPRPRCRIPTGGCVKIFVEPDHFAINIVFESDDAGAQPRFDAALDTIFKIVLPAIEAREITETDTYE